MTQSPDPRASAEKGGAPAAPPLWEKLHYPNEALYQVVQRLYPETFGRTYFDLAPFIRLGWPSKEVWDRVHAARPEWAGRPWAELQATYPERPEVPPDGQDLARLIRLWPDCIGEPMVDCVLIMREGITINTITYGPGTHRVPRAVAVDLRHIDQRAHQAFLDQFIPRVHQEKVLAELSMKGSE